MTPVRCPHCNAEKVAIREVVPGTTVIVAMVIVPLLTKHY